MPDALDYRNAILRCSRDGSSVPSVQVPLGDFFGTSRCRVSEFTTELLVVNTGMGTSHGLKAYVPMPFSESAVVTLENRGDEPLGGISGAFRYHVDYEAYTESLPEDVQRFHAVYRQEPADRGYR